MTKTSAIELFRKWNYWILLGVIVIFHSVGLIGLQTTSRDYFLSLSPMNLLLAFTCLVLSFQFSMRLFFDLIIVGIIGFSAELIGVHTHYLFGNYAYGANLGWKLGEVPVIIAVNWSMLSFAAIACVFHLSLPDWAKAFLSALLMTGLDFLIEPVAVSSDFWSWENGVIPLFNYVCWFLIALPLHFYLIKRKTPEQNPVSIGLFLVLIVFFGVLNFCE